MYNFLKKDAAGRRSSRQPGLLRSPCRPRWVRQKPRRKRCRLHATSARGRGSDCLLYTSDAADDLPCVELLEKGVGWATVVEAAGASAAPVPTSVGSAKTEVKALSAAGKTRPRLGQQSTVVTEAETRATNSRKSRKVVNPRTWPVCTKIAKIGGGERMPTQNSTFSAGH